MGSMPPICCRAEVTLPRQGTDPWDKYFSCSLSAEGAEAKRHEQHLQQQEGFILHTEPQLDMGVLDELEPRWTQTYVGVAAEKICEEAWGRVTVFMQLQSESTFGALVSKHKGTVTCKANTQGLLAPSTKACYCICSSQLWLKQSLARVKIHIKA